MRDHNIAIVGQKPRHTKARHELGLFVLDHVQHRRPRIECGVDLRLKLVRIQHIDLLDELGVFAAPSGGGEGAD